MIDNLKFEFRVSHSASKERKLYQVIFLRLLNTKFTNGSSEAITLVSVQIFESGSSDAGNNVLESEVEVAAGESKAYGLRIGTSMTTPVVRFTYQYNKKKYTAEATWNL